jgi:ABC-2 type transport system ATP-binding protein
LSVSITRAWPTACPGASRHRARIDRVGSAIEIDDLVKRYGATEAVQGVSVTVDEGETYGYLGPNGSGKTTTIRCLLGLLRPTSGSIRVFGSDVSRDLGSILSRIGHIPGEFGLWPQMTGRECLEYLGSLHPRMPVRFDELCDRFELRDADLDKEVRFYSRGMRQKIAIVQAFQHDPELVILDEPTEGLDPVLKDRFMALLREQRAQGGTVFLSSHILSEVEECADRVAVLRAGRVVKEAPTEELAESRVRHCTVTFKRPLDEPSVLDLAGVSHLRGDSEVVHFDYRGDMNVLIDRLSGLGVRDFLAEPASLREAFFEVYAGEQK